MEVIIDFTSYILQHHQGESGIIYFLSQKVMLRTRLIFARVAELMLLLEFPGCRDGAKRVFETSNGVIMTGIYHANKFITAKEYLHLQWKRGAIKVVCATTGSRLFGAFCTCLLTFSIKLSAWV